MALPSSQDITMRSLYVLLASVLVTASAEIVLQQADRKISLQSQFVRITESLKFKNTGSGAVDSLLLCTLTALAEKTAYQKVSDVSAGQTVLTVKPVATPPSAPQGVSCVQAVLKSSLPAGEVASLSVESTIANAQTPNPAEVLQTDTQLVVYEDTVYILSPYAVVGQSTELLFLNNAIKSYTDTEKPTIKSEAKLRYGRYDNIEPFRLQPLRVHYENQKPFRTAVSLVREVTVSHWGNIYVEETYELKNTGAKHKGAFSRLKYSYSHDGKANSYQELKAHLPASAHHLYYVDIIGNISSSHTRKNMKETVLDFKTRYPLMGGWKVDFTLGYSVPLDGFLFKKKSDGKFRLAMDFGTPIDDVFVQDLTVRVILPEGSSDIKALIPLEGVETSFDKHFTYLDTTGRPVLVVHKKNVVPEHAATLNVDYHVASFAMLRKVLLLITAFGTLFVFAMAYNRLELTISRDDKWLDAQSNVKLITLAQQISTLVEGQQGLLDQMAKVATLLRDPEDIDRVTAERAELDRKMRDFDEQLKPLLVRLESSKALSSGVRDAVDKVHAVQARIARLFAERVELVKKGVSVLDINRKVAASNVQVHELTHEVKEQIAMLFAPY